MSSRKEKKNKEKRSTKKTGSGRIFRKAGSGLLSSSNRRKTGSGKNETTPSFTKEDAEKAIQLINAELNKVIKMPMFGIDVSKNDDRKKDIDNSEKRLQTKRDCYSAISKLYDERDKEENAGSQQTYNMVLTQCWLIVNGFDPIEDKYNKIKDTISSAFNKVNMGKYI